jgi:transketolase
MQEYESKSDAKAILRNLRSSIIRSAFEANEGHIPSALSILDVLWVLYETVLAERMRSGALQDRFILSKGHGSLALYAVLAGKGAFEKEELSRFCQFDSILGGHPDRTLVPGVEASTGSLGHGLPIAVGLAMSQKIGEQDARTYVLIGDGEANEGTTWESALLAAHHNLGNLSCIVDFNHSTDRALEVAPLDTKFEAFGWRVLNVSGHDHEELKAALEEQLTDRPTLVLAHTIKGFGVPVMENNPEWHHRAPKPGELDQILAQVY